MSILKQMNVLQPKPPLRILVADDEARVRYGLRLLIQHQPGLVMAGEAADVAELAAQLTTAQADLLLLDWELLGLNNQQTLATIRRQYPQLGVIVISSRLEARHVALAAGADAFVGKTEPPERLLEALKAAGPSEGN